MSVRQAPPRPILIAHNVYQRPGGEDQVFQAETRLLSARGHEVIAYEANNAVIGATAGLGVAARTVWSRPSYRAIRRLCHERKPAVLHCHNTFPLLSPSVYYAAHAEGVPVVQTLHNFRLTCPSATLFRDQRVCTDCIGKRVAWPGVLHACYRNSRAATGVAAAMLALHRSAGTFRRQVDVFISLTEFARAQLIRAGLPPDRVFIKPNFVFPDPGSGPHDEAYALFVGRLSPEKGVRTLVQAWERIGRRFTLKVVGDGPDATYRSSSGPGVEWLGWQARDQVLALMKHARFLIMPSEWYENFPMTLVEAYATGLPVVASDLGSMAELVAEGRTGRRFPVADPDALAAIIDWAITHPGELTGLGKEARAEFEQRYTAEASYQALVSIYEAARVHACGNR